MSTRATKKIPEFIYFVGGDNSHWVEGPYVNPKKGYSNRKFKLVEVIEKPLKMVGVISFNLNDFLDFKSTLDNVENGDYKDKFISNNVHYQYIGEISSICSRRFDDIYETERAKEKKDYNNIKAVITTALNPKQNDI